MGQPVAVVEKASSRPGMVRFEANRNLTGMGHERFRSTDEAIGERPAAELARRLFQTGKVESIHIYLNMVTVDLLKGRNSEGLAGIVENLYIYWRPGMKPPSPEELMASVESPADASGTSAPAADGGGSGAAIDSRIPALLLERSRQALAKWKAAQAESA